MADEQQTLVPAQAVPGAAKAVTKFTAEDAHEVRLPSPSAVNYMVSVANLLLDSTLITNDMGTTPEQTRSNAIAKMLVGLDFEMSPMESLMEVDIVKSRIFMRYPRLIAAMEKKGLQPRWVERTNEKCSIGVTRPGRQEEIFTYSIEDARMAGLVRQGSQYELRPRVMLSARAASEAYRMTGGRSNVYTPEEKSEIVEHDRDNGAQPATEPPNRFNVGRKPAPGSDAEFAAVGKAAAADPKPPVVETTAHVVETPGPEPAKKPVASETVESPAETEPAARTKVCGCVAPACLMMEDGKVPAGRFCREGRTLGVPETAAPVVEQATGPQTVADDPVKVLRQQVYDTLTSMTDSYPQQSPKTVMSKFNNFFRGVLGVTTLPKDPEVYQGLIPALAAAIRSEKDAFWKDPAGAGRVEAEDRKVISEKLAEWKWSAALTPLILKVKYFFGIMGSDVCEYIEKTHELTKVTPAAAEAFLRMATVSREVYRIRPIAKFTQMGYDALLKQMETKMEKPVEQFSDKQFVALLELAERTMAEETAKEPEPISPTVGQSAAEPEQGGLPWDTEA